MGQAMVLSQVSCNQPGTTGPAAGWGPGLTGKQRHIPSATHCTQVWCCLWGVWDLLWLTPQIKSLPCRAGGGRRVVNSNNKYAARDTAQFWSYGDPQINTTQSIPEGTPSSGGAYVKTETWPL